MFDSVITPVVLYGCASWALTEEMSNELKVLWRRMVRMIVGVRRRPEETWVEYNQRSTRQAENYAKGEGHSDWPALQKTRKWRFAGKLASGSGDKWSERMLSWLPWFRTIPARSVGRPKTRWRDDIERFAGGDWQQTAEDGNMWALLQNGFTTGL